MQTSAEEISLDERYGIVHFKNGHIKKFRAQEVLNKDETSEVKFDKHHITKENKVGLCAVEFDV